MTAADPSAKATDPDNPCSSESTLASNSPKSPALLDLQTELLILIAKIVAFGYESPTHINSLLLTNWRLSSICTPLLTERALSFRLSKGSTILHYAAYFGYPNVAERLLSAGMDVDIFGTQPGHTPLRTAAQFGRVNVMQLLISSGASVRGKGPKRLPPIITAAQNGHTAAIDLLVANGAYFNAAKTDKRWRKGNAWGEWPDGNMALHWAARNNHVDAVQKLLAYGADASAKDEDGLIVLLKAASFGNRYPNGLRQFRDANCYHRNTSTDVVQFLISTGVNISEVDRNGNTALHVSLGNLQTTKLLCHPSIVNVPNDHGLTPLHIACRPGAYNCIKLLLDSGADIEAKNKEGQTPLIFSLAEGYWMEDENDPYRDTIEHHLEILLENGANINAVDNKGLSALDHAVYRGIAQEVEVLLEYGARPDYMHVRIAIRAEGDDRLVELLLEHGADKGSEEDETDPEEDETDPEERRNIEV